VKCRSIRQELATYALAALKAEREKLSRVRDIVETRPGDAEVEVNVHSCYSWVRTRFCQEIIELLASPDV
jgi:hypothetical protein